MALLHKASVETKRFDLGDEGDFIQVRMEIAKREFNKFIAYMPGREVNKEDGLTPAEAVELQTGLFEALVVGWSLEAPCEVSEYLGLSTESAGVIDEAVAAHFASLNPTKQEEKVGFRPE